MVNLPDNAGYQISEEFLSFNRVNGIWYVKCKSSEVLAAERKLEDGDNFVIDQANRIAVFVYEEKVDDTSQISFSGKERLKVGRNPDCEIRLPDKKVSGYQLQFYQSGGIWGVANESHTNPTFLNHRILGEGGYRVNEGDVISFCRYNLVFHEQEQRIVVKKMVDVGAEERQADYPYWYEPAPRLLKKLRTEDFDIDPVPPSMKAMEFNFFQFANSAAAAAIMMSPLALLSLTSQIGNTEMSKKKAKEYEELRQKKYGAYLDRKEQEINDLKKEQRTKMLERDPELAGLQATLNNLGAGLWDRRPCDEDFMNLRIGFGEGDTSFRINGPKDAFTMVEDNLEDRAKDIVKAGKRIPNLPITCDLAKHKLIGIVGPRTDVKTIAKNMILHAAAHHSYEDLRIVVVYDRKEEKDFSWVRWLPHCFSEGRDVRFISNSRTGATMLLSAMKDIFEKRLAEAEKNTTSQGTQGMFAPHFLFVFSQMELAKNQDILNILQKQNENIDLGASVIYLYETMSQLPTECRIIIKADSRKSTILDKNNVDDAVDFAPDASMYDGYERMARKMAPLRLALRKDEASLPTCVTFLDGYRVRRAEDIDIATRWGNTRPHKSLAVPIGVNVDGEVFRFDIHEKFHGVHGLVAGTTGSGKSEMVQSWILSMALHFPPEEVSFVLIDFKGTGLIRPFRDLPHLAGTISNLDNKIHRNLIALRHELVRRQQLLDSCKAKTGIEVNDIKDYLELYKSGRIPDPMPYLFIVIDEFAEFKVQFPDFMAEVESVFKIGRALGVFAILLTQAPGGVVTAQMDKNMRFRWCLKVGSPADSKEVMHHPDAARISVPGRAYVRVGNDEVYELIQSYYSGAKYRPDEEIKTGADQSVAIVEENGKRIRFKEEEEKKSEGKTDQTQIGAVVAHLRDFVKKTGRATAAQVWLPKIPYRISLEQCDPAHNTEPEWEKGQTGLSPVIGMVDDPAAQTQYSLKLDFAANGHHAVYGAPSTGKTTLLQTAMMSLIRTYSPEDVNIYAMDFGGWNLGIFRDFPQVGGIANDNEEEKVEKLAQFIDRQIDLRKELFSAEGVGNLTVYEQATGKHLPSIVLVLDNFGSVLQLYPKLDQFFIRLTQQGGNYGVYLLVTANSQSALGFRIYQNIKMSLSLNMADKGDYMAIVGKTGGLEPENTEGRGLVKGKPVLEFQTALPMEAENDGRMIQKIREAGAKMKQEYHGARAVPIPVMPEMIRSEDLPDNAVGLTIRHVEPVILPENKEHYLLVSGPSGTGKTNMLKALAGIWATRGAESVTYIDVKKSADDMKGLDGIRYISEAEEMDAFVESLIPELQSRQAAKKEGREDFTDRVILLDDYDLALEKMSEQTHNRLAAIIKLGEGLHVHLILSCPMDVYNKYVNQGENVCSMVRGAKLKFLTGGNIRSYTTIPITADTAQKTYDLGRNEVYMIYEDTITLMKAVCGGKR